MPRAMTNDENELWDFCITCEISSMQIPSRNKNSWRKNWMKRNKEKMKFPVNKRLIKSVIQNPNISFVNMEAIREGAV